MARLFGSRRLASRKCTMAASRRRSLSSAIPTTCWACARWLELGVSKDWAMASTARQSFPVLQRGSSVSLGLSTVAEGSAAGNDSVVLGVYPNTTAWTATANVGWLHLSATSQNGTGSTNVFFSYDANPGATRAGTLSIAGQPLTVTQAGSTYVAVNPVTTLVPSGGPGPWGVGVDGVGNVYYYNYYQHVT